MESLIKLAQIDNRIHNAAKYFVNLIDFSKFVDVLLKSNIDIKEIIMAERSNIIKMYDFSKMTTQEYLTLFTKIDNFGETVVIGIFNGFFTNTESPISLQEMLTINFDLFDDEIKRKCITIMLKNDISSDIICLLLDKLKTVNYGYVNSPVSESTNPLAYCCSQGKFDMVKILIEKYNASVNSIDCWNKSPMRVCAQNHHIEIALYLYDKGAVEKEITLHIEDLAKLLNNKNIEFAELKQKHDKILEFIRSMD